MRASSTLTREEKEIDQDLRPLELTDTTRAADVPRGVANRTPVLTSRTLDDLVGASVFLKGESFQRSGSFKDAPAAKLNATRGYGAEVVMYDRYSNSQAEAGQRLTGSVGVQRFSDLLGART